MASTKDKVQKALSEVRTLILGVQILFGFQYQSLAAANRGMDLGMRPLRQADLGDRRHHHAPLQAAADPVVLGRLLDGHPLQRHLGAATATPARPRLLQIGLAVVYLQIIAEKGRMAWQKATGYDRRNLIEIAPGATRRSSDRSCTPASCRPSEARPLSPLRRSTT